MAVGGEASSQTVLHLLSRFDIHLQAKLETFETKMAARNAGRSISMILWKNSGGVQFQLVAENSWSDCGSFSLSRLAGIYLKWESEN